MNAPPEKKKNGNGMAKPSHIGHNAVPWPAVPAMSHQSHTFLNVFTRSPLSKALQELPVGL